MENFKVYVARVSNMTSIARSPDCNLSNPTEMSHVSMRCYTVIPLRLAEAKPVSSQLHHLSFLIKIWPQLMEVRTALEAAFLETLKPPINLNLKTALAAAFLETLTPRINLNL